MNPRHISSQQKAFWTSSYPLVGALVVSLLLLVTATLLAAPQTPTVSPAPQTAAEHYKNIKVLTDIPADQLIPSMQFITASLGVECEFCHVHGAFDKDDKKPKVVARKMMTMMMAINKDNFEGHREVTCYSCHRGAEHPVPTPIIAAEESPKTEAAEDAAKPTLPAAEQLLDKYLAAVGGADALKKITSRVETGAASFAGQSVPVDVYAKAPDKRLSAVHLKDGDSLTAFDGQQGWLSVPARTHMMSAAENSSARIDADFYFPINIKTLYEKFRVEPGEKIDGHDTYLLIGRKEGQPPLRLYLDTQSGLLLRLVRYAETPLGRNPTQIDYADYRESGGVKIPFRWTLARPGNQFTIQITDVKQNVAIDDSKFAPPPAPKNAAH
ncbi:MAG TPA: c-type cytochrome [Candidatus Dormibacteraeota bacterium]|nr:c-type cytochrome [Candidatus Dormibacteraeota bacterium]